MESIEKKTDALDDAQTASNKDGSLPNPSRRKLLQNAGLCAAGAALAYLGMSKVGLLPGGGGSQPPPASGEMTYRTNPRNGDKLSLLGYGCMRFPLVPNAATSYGPYVDETAAIKLIDYAMEHGINFYDSAYVYNGGMSEMAMGRALKRHKRSSYFISTKMATSEKPTLEEAKKMFATQLERCQTDYVDYYLLHNISLASVFKEIYEDRGILEYLHREKSAGRIRNLGFSFHGDKECLDYLLSCNVAWDVALVQLNYHDLLRKYRPQVWLSYQMSTQPAEPRWVLEQMSKTDIPLMVMEPLLGGRLGKLTRKAVAVLKEENPDASAASWAFRYVAPIPNVITVLSGMTFMEHLQDNIKTFSPLEPITEKELAVLQRALDYFVHPDIIPCTACDYCQPCPYGVDIPAVFAHNNNCIDNSIIPKEALGAEYARARRAYLVGYDRTVSELSQAERCTGCNECVTKCPQFIPIPDEMARLGKYAEQLRNEL